MRSVSKRPVRRCRNRPERKLTGATNAVPAVASVAQWLHVDPHPVIHLRLRPFALTAAAVLASGSMAPLPARAQAAAPGGAAPATRPASDRDVNIYNQMGAVNICVLATKQVGLDKSLPASLEMIVSTLNFVHGGIIQGANNNKKLEANQLANGTVFGVVPRIKQMCFDKFTAADKKTIDDLMAQIQKALQGQGQSGGSR